MSLRSSKIRVPALRLCAAALLLPAALSAQTTPSAPASAAPAASQAPAIQLPDSGKKPAVPDYPDPRTITVGVFYWILPPSPEPKVTGGLAATGYGDLSNLGSQHSGEVVQFSIPITRTGEIKLEGFLAKGTGSQTDAKTTTVFSTTFSPGYYLSTQYQIEGAKIYLDDLLFPYKFPVSKFRLKSLWEFQYMQISSTVDAPLAPQTDISGNAVSTTGQGSKNILFPEFGIAAEYAFSPHILFRASGSGFGLPHRSYIWEGDATVSWRRGANLEFRAGFKGLGFKTSPKNDFYFSDVMAGGFVGVLYHFH